MANVETGRLGESIAATYYRSHGYSIRDQNIHSRFGELDLVVEKNGIIRFVEVKTRTGIRKGKPYESVTRHKLISLLRNIQYYIIVHKIHHKKYSLFVFAIILTERGSVDSMREYEISL